MDLETLRHNLNRHGCSVRAGATKSIYYLTAQNRRHYTLTLGQDREWHCDPLGHTDTFEAENLLAIALGRRKHDD